MSKETPSCDLFALHKLRTCQFSHVGLWRHTPQWCSLRVKVENHICWRAFFIFYIGGCCVFIWQHFNLVVLNVGLSIIILEVL